MFQVTTCTKKQASTLCVVSRVAKRQFIDRFSTYDDTPQSYHLPTNCQSFVSRGHNGNFTHT
jgi:hypothetical protein